MTVYPSAPLAEATIEGHLRGGEVTWTSWHFDWPLLLPALLVTACYIHGLRRLPHGRGGHPAWRSWCYFLGVATLVLAQESPLHELADRHFSAHMVQHMLLMMVAVPLVLLGAPMRPVLRGMPRTLRRAVVRPLMRSKAAGAIYRGVTHPVAGLAVYSALLGAWHLAPGWYDASVRNEFWHDMQHVSFAGGILLFWWNVIDPAPFRVRLGYPLRMLYVLVGGTIQGTLAALITFSDRTLYTEYVHATPVFDISPLADQELGGLIMWVPGQLQHLAVIGVLFAVWAVSSERRQRAEEARALASTPAR